ncbi:Clp protease ClpP [Desulfovibrio sp. OttesenSCG-928-A18]|nr:Clp protease ClpP [Desulfovibrio sp. OttesenSCG-928-A18]
MALKVQNKTKDAAEIFIYDEIGEGWYGGISAKAFAEEVKKLGDVKTIDVFINSPGGYVFEGVAIYNTLKNNKARVIVHIDGLAASIASIIAMAGDEVHMAANAFIMIHNPWSGLYGFAEDFRKEADRLDLIAGTLRDTYTAKANGKTSAEQFAAWMDEEKWFTAVDAMDAGLVDTITEELQAAAKFDLSKFNYRNIPKDKVSGASLVDMPEDRKLRARMARMTMWQQKHKTASAQ